jgi:predicted nucleotidyltransferase
VWRFVHVDQQGFGKISSRSFRGAGGGVPGFPVMSDLAEIPNMGMIEPEMGIREKSMGLADALFSTARQRVLGLLFGQPDRSFYATEIIRLAGVGSGAVQRELVRLKNSGLVTVTRQATQKHYQANPQSPLFEELRSIARKTVGMAEPLREALAPLADRIDAAFVYGSVAKRADTVASDIDLMIVSDSVDYPDAMQALQAASVALGREVSPTIYKRRELASRRDEGNAFVRRVLEQPKLWIYGDDDALAV